MVKLKRVGVVSLGFEVAEKPVFMRVCGLNQNCRSGFATLLQHVDCKKCFATDEIVSSGYQVNRKNEYFEMGVPALLLGIPILLCIIDKNASFFYYSGGGKNNEE